MYALVESGSITKIFTSPKGFVLNNNQYPQDIFYKWTKDEKEAIGIYEVITDSTNKKDEAYYINTNEEYNFSNNQVTRSWGTATPKKLEDESGVDNLGNEFTNHGLKTEKKRIVKLQASGLLAPTDWHVVKATEVADYNVPENITSYRADVRSKSNEMENQIDACTNVDELKTLYEYVNVGTLEKPIMERPLGEFPVLEA